MNAYHSFKKHSKYSDAAVGLHLEGPYFSNTDKISKGAQSGDLIRYISFAEIAELLNTSDGSIIRWDAAPEIANSVKFAEICKENNIICAAAHTNARALKVLCVDYGIGILTAAKMLSTNPAVLINEENIGRIKEGFFADLVITDNNFNVKTVINRGRVTE